RTGWYWGAAQEATAVLIGDGTADLWLPDHASAVSAVVERAYDGGTETPLAGADYALRKPPGATHGLRLVRRGGSVWTYGYEYVVTYTRGYTETAPASGDSPADVAAPDDIRQAVTGLVTLWFEQAIPVALGTVAPPVPDHVAAILAARRKGRV
ncbi:MAG TPA: hypothetical protein VF158_08140, partial [Longimicrobiales bacterium]